LWAQVTEQNGKKTEEKMRSPHFARMQPLEERENENYMEEKAVS